MADYRFTVTWWERNIPGWEQLKVLKGWGAHEPLTAIEVGCFEGRSTCWLLEHLLGHPESRLLCIDHFEGSAEIMNLVSTDLLDRWEHNVQQTGMRNKISLFTQRSDEALMEVSRAFAGDVDLIYLDGSHATFDVLSDAVLSWPLLKPGGVMVFDDYLYTINEADLRKNPKRAIDAFAALVAPDAEVLNGFHKQQFGLMKRVV